MTRHGFGRTHGDFVIAEEVANGVSFERISDWRRGAVSVYVADVGRTDFGVADGIAHHSEAAFVLRGGLGDVIGISAHAVANDFRNRLGSSGASMLEVFHDQNSGAFADDESIAIAVPRTAGFFRLVVAGGESP